MTYLFLYIVGIILIWWIYRVGWLEALNNPTTGLLKSNLPAFMLNKIISAEGTMTLTTVLSASSQPTRYVHHIKITPTT